jgi:chromate transporter
MQRVPILSLLRVFLWLSTTTYGGGQSAAIRREVVRNRGWITEEEYLEFRSIALIVPGPNSPNLALLVGLRLSGTAGAIVSYAASSLPSAVILLILGVLSLDPHLGPLRSALRGCAAAAVGLTFANALEMTAPYRDRLLELGLVVLSAACVLVLHFSLWLTLLTLVPIAVLLTARRAQLRKKST